MKGKCFLCTLILALFAIPISINAQMTGDVNGDGSVTIVDGLIVAQRYVGLSPSPSTRLWLM